MRPIQDRQDHPANVDPTVLQVTQDKVAVTDNQERTVVQDRKDSQDNQDVQDPKAHQESPANCVPVAVHQQDVQESPAVLDSQDHQDLQERPAKMVTTAHQAREANQDSPANQVVQESQERQENQASQEMAAHATTAHQPVWLQDIKQQQHTPAMFSSRITTTTVIVITQLCRTSPH